MSYWSADGPIKPYTTHDDIRKSPLDDRQYRYLKLPNGMRCVVVSDQDVETSAACLFVANGSLCDPMGVPERDGTSRKVEGLAHFLEHMVFMGTEKYPDEGYYEKTLAQHGGNDNAATGDDYTYYWFQVKNNHFEEMIDIFSWLYKAPLFTASATGREVNAVDNEYKLDISDEDWAKYQILQNHIAIPGSILDRFTIGNAETLNIDGILDELRIFYERYYSSNLMSLVLVGRASVDELEKMAFDNFHEVIDRNLPRTDHTNEQVFNKEHSFQKIFKIVPSKDLRQLQFFWILPYERLFGRKQSNKYLNHLFAQDGPNSLYSHLSKEGLASKVYAGSSQECKESYTQYELTIELTEKGDAEWFKVIEIVYLMINNLKAEGPQTYIYEQSKQKAQIDFDNITKKDAIDVAKQIARRMNYMADDADYVKLMQIPYIFDDFNQDDIRARLDLFVPDNMFIVQYSPSFQKELEDNPSIFKKEYYFSKHFTVKEITDEEAQRLKNASMESVYPGRSKEEVKLGHPPPNEFMPNPDNMVSKKIARPPGNDGKPALPKKIDSDKYTLWFKQDDTFDQPIVKMACFMYTKDAGYPDNLTEVLLAKLWKKALKQHVNEMRDMASNAGISSNMSVTNKYIRLNYRCYNDKITEYLRYLASNFHACEMNEELFKNVVDKKCQTQKNELKEEPYRKLMPNFRRAVLGEPTAEQIIKTYQGISYEQFMQFKSKFMHNVRFEWLICGHLEEQEAVNVCEVLCSGFDHTVMSEEQKPAKKQMFEIPENTVYQLELSSQAPKEFDPDGGKVVNPNSACRCLFQLGPFDYDTYAIVEVLYELMYDPAYNQLRTNEQLGYIASARCFKIEKQMIGSVIVQSSKYSADYLEWRINVFLESLREKGGFTEEQVENVRKATIKEYEQVNLSINDEFGNLVTQFKEEVYTFDHNERMIEALKKFTVDQLNQFFVQTIFTKPRRMNVKMMSGDHVEKNQEEIGDAKAKNQKIYEHDQGLKIMKLDETNIDLYNTQNKF